MKTRGAWHPVPLGTRFVPPKRRITEVDYLSGAGIGFEIFGLMSQWLSAIFGWYVPATVGLGLVA